MSCSTGKDSATHPKHQHGSTPNSSRAVTNIDPVFQSINRECRNNRRGLSQLQEQWIYINVRKIIEYEHAPCCGHICGLTNAAGDSMERQRLTPFMLQSVFSRILSLLPWTEKGSGPPSQGLLGRLKGAKRQVLSQPLSLGRFETAKPQSQW